MRAPEFWRRGGGGLAPALLAPVGWTYGLAAWCRARMATPWKAPAPVVCVGNLVAGGAGKTPVARAIGQRLRERGAAPHFLSRGYGGWEPGPHRVDPLDDTAERVGDEPLLLARTAPTWVARNRADGARAAIDAGAGAIVMDDGFQNPSLAKDLSLLVIDGRYGLGNGRLMPAGPLREFPGAAIERADAVVLIEPDETGVARTLAGPGSGRPLLRARLSSKEKADVAAGRPAIAFCGIALPEKFSRSLDEAGWTVLRLHAFADHHPYTADEITRMKNEARHEGAVLVTTEKDWVRLPRDRRDGIQVLTIALHWENESGLDALLDTMTP